jgi:hypothetical protein
MKAKEPIREEGPTEHGGAYTLTFHYPDGMTEIAEYDQQGRQIFRTYLRTRNAPA